MSTTDGHSIDLGNTAGASKWDINLDTSTAHLLAAINAEADTAIVTYKLDHLVFAAESDDPADDSIMAKLVSATADWSTFVSSTDSLQAIRDSRLLIHSG